MLSDEQIERYSRQIILPQVGGKGQEQLLSAKVLVHANGSLHASTLHYLAAAGVGTLGVFGDARDKILTSLASSQDTNSASVLTRLNPDCTIVVHQPDALLSPRRLVEEYDVVIADSAVLHDACWQACRPFVYASFADDDAWLAVFRGYEEGEPCLHCEPRALAALANASALAPIATLFIGAQLATEAVKHLLGVPRSQTTRRLRFHFPTFQCQMEVIKKAPLCPECGPGCGPSVRN
ncbi:MAG: hypothetical protein HYZ50_13915 [Deltaproteobacteria bacterium]|nr:hypothetical protein [Deltaproteobacteria bacterium]